MNTRSLLVSSQLEIKLDYIRTIKRDTNVKDHNIDVFYKHEK